MIIQHLDTLVVVIAGGAYGDELLGILMLVIMLCGKLFFEASLHTTSVLARLSSFHSDEVNRKIVCSDS
jgi:hypothetical protein